MSSIPPPRDSSSLIDKNISRSDSSLYQAVDSAPTEFSPILNQRKSKMLDVNQLKSSNNSSTNIPRTSSIEYLNRSPSSAVSLSNLIHRQSVQSPIANAVKHPKKLYNVGSLLLENKGSVARDHLASERTFLAWLRTSLSLASIGVGITQLLKLGSGDPSSPETLELVSKIIGLLFIAVAIFTLIVGSFRYFIIQDMLLISKFPASRAAVMALCGTVFLLSATMFVIVLRL